MRSLLPDLLSAATPGPWDVGTSRLVGEPAFPTIWPRDRSPMCTLDRRPGVPKERNEADAQLAALAPTMASLLVEALELLVTVMDEEHVAEDRPLGQIINDFLARADRV